jgi:thioredoxin-like negative regulator of GroEL
MVCPKCGRPRVEGPECPACGVVYARYRPPAPRPSEPTPPVEEDRRSGPRLATALAALAVAGLAAAVAARTIAARRAAREDERAATPEAVAPAAESARPDSREPPGPADAPRDAPAVAAALETPPASPAEVPRTAAPPPEPASCAIYAPDGIPDPAPRPRVSSDWHVGAAGFRRAMEEGESAAAPVVALFFTTWCPHCRRFDAQVVPSAEVRELAAVKVRVDAEGGEGERELALKYGVRSYPTVLLFRPDGTPPMRVPAEPSARAFVAACERALPDPAREHLDRGVSLGRAGPSEQAVQELKAAASDPRVAPLALDHLGSLALRASCFGRAEAVYTRVLELAPADEGGRVHYLRGLARVRTGAVALALADAEEACRLGHREGCGVAERARAAGAAR